MRPKNAWQVTSQVVDPDNIYWVLVPQGVTNYVLNYAVVARDKITGMDLAFSYFGISSSVGNVDPAKTKRCCSV